MIDFSNISQYRENNRIEAKKALGGLPRSIWETYSAFANTLGGVILLGVEEDLSDHSLHTVDLPEPERLVREFWTMLNDPRKVSVNILSDRHIQIQNMNGNHMISITVPRAQRCDRPVTVGEDPFVGAYRRSGEGDYRCSREEVQAMLRDAAAECRDAGVLDGVDRDALDRESVRAYRAHMAQHRPGHAWETLEETEFLRRLGAVGTGEDGALHPTAAGLLMFGASGEIARRFPHYQLTYRDGRGEITSQDEGWSGNLYGFYCQVRAAMMQEADETSVGGALKEALVNCLVNADYDGRSGVVVTGEPTRITFSNPGGFRIGMEAARSGGVSDPRNGTLIRMFNMISASEGVGGGIPRIYAVWKRQGWAAPVIEERFDPERTTLILRFEPDDGEKPVLRQGFHRAAVIAYLTKRIRGSREELEELLGIDRDHAERLLAELTAEGIVMREEESGLYQLKA